MCIEYNAVVNITGTKTIKDNKTRHYYTLRGVASGRYLCLSRRRRQPRKHTYIFLYERREDRQLHLAITAHGEARMRPRRVPPRYRRRGTAGRRRAHSREREPAPAATESAAELTTEPSSRSAREQSRRPLPTGRPRQQRAQRRAQRRRNRQRRRRRQRLRKERQRRRQQRLQRQQRRRRPARHVRAGRAQVPPAGAKKSPRRRPRRRHQRGRSAPQGILFRLMEAKLPVVHEALRLERQRLAQFAKRCRQDDSGSWQARTCRSLRVKRTSTTQPEPSTPPAAAATAAPVTALALREAAADVSADRAGGARDSSAVRGGSAGRDRSAGAPSVSRLDCVRRRQPGRATRCRQWRAKRRQYKLILQHRRDLRRSGLV
ncbi:hypothetical protein FJT64_006813 [Amphibalanus amphitrite]|uniref:Uncharacterized protein n=1 Tax=Amphibalanus amphitrite TaxID=1232801 RepID=A0A6A4VH00_AMPAM|nr:hypothetical protein FJT64_006813 [Amphibalanus amphitrite]